MWCRGPLAIFCLLLIANQCHAVQPETDDVTRLRIAASGIKRNLELCDFEAKFEYSVGFAASLDDARERRLIVEEWSKPDTWSASGSLKKSGEHIWYEVNMRGLSDFDLNTSSASRISEQIFFGPNLLLNKVPRQENELGQTLGGYLNVRSSASLGELRDKLKLMKPIGPYLPPFVPFEVSRVLIEQSHISAVNQEIAGEKVLELSLYDINGDFLEKIKVSFENFYPELLETKGSNWHGWLTDYVGIGTSTRIPQKFLMAIGPLEIIGSTSNAWKVHYCEFSDARPCNSQSDRFTISLSEGEAVFGIERPNSALIDCIELDKTTQISAAIGMPPHSAEAIRELEANPNSNEWTIVALFFLSMSILCIGVLLVRKFLRSQVLLVFFVSMTTIGCDSEHVRLRFYDDTSDVIEDQRPTIADVDLGVVLFDSTTPDAYVDASFFVKNEQEGDVRYSIVGTTCGCLATSISSEPVSPGQEVCVTVKIDPNRSQGAFMHNIILKGKQLEKDEWFECRAVVRGAILPAYLITGFESQPIELVQGLPVRVECFAYGYHPVPVGLDVICDTEHITVEQKLLQRATDGTYFRNKWEVVFSLNNPSERQSISQIRFNGRQSTLQFATGRHSKAVAESTLFFREINEPLEVRVETPEPIKLDNVSYNRSLLCVEVENTDSGSLFTIAIKEGAANSLYESIIVRDRMNKSLVAKIQVAYFQ